MSLIGDVIAGCAPGTSECADHTSYPGMDAWFVVLVLAVLLVAVAAGTVLLAGRRSSRRPAGDQLAGGTTPRA